MFPAPLVRQKSSTRRDRLDIGARRHGEQAHALEVAGPPIRRKSTQDGRVVEVPRRRRPRRYPPPRPRSASPPDPLESAHDLAGVLEQRSAPEDQIPPTTGLLDGRSSRTEYGRSYRSRSRRISVCPTTRTSTSTSLPSLPADDNADSRGGDEQTTHRPAGSFRRLRPGRSEGAEDGGHGGSSVGLPNPLPLSRRPRRPRRPLARSARRGRSPTFGCILAPIPSPP